MRIKSENKVNVYGMRPKYNPQFITVQKSVLSKGEFPRAIVVYMHELLHQYGDDVSMQFRQALLYMNQIILHNLDKLAVYQEEWNYLNKTEGMEAKK